MPVSIDHEDPKGDCEEDFERSAIHPRKIEEPCFSLDSKYETT
jgi:hypothetical protein